MADTAYLLLVPYLALKDPVEFSGWWLGPVSEFEGRWPSDRFRDLAYQLMLSLRGPDGQQLEEPSLLADCATGIDGALPEPVELAALQRAIHFAVLNGNPSWSSRTENEGLWMSSSDNSSIHAWPIDLNDGSVTLSSGSMISVQAGGYRLEDGIAIPAPEELWIPWVRPLDQELLQAVHSVMSDPDLGDRGFAHRVGVAIDWLAHGWRNSPSITFEQRVVMLKIGFEALTGRSGTHGAATWLESRFTALSAAGVEDRHAEHLLWSPSEIPHRTRTWGQGESAKCTDLVHWFHALGDARNDIVHKGSASTLYYEEYGSAYGGPLPNVAERLLREVILVCLRDFGFDDLWETAAHRSIKRTLEEYWNVFFPEEE